MRRHTLSALAACFLLLATGIPGMAQGDGKNKPAGSLSVHQSTKGPLRTEEVMRSMGLLDIQEEIPGILVELMYAKEDNFMNEVLYTDLDKAFLHPDAVRALKKAVAILQKERPDLRLIVYDAARPMHIQKAMWDRVKGTAIQNYVSNPKNGGGLHNYGLAVDVSLATASGDSIPMGSLVDHMGFLSHINRESALVSSGRISKEALQNRRLLRSIMTGAGWMSLGSEWWHYNLVSRSTAQKQYITIP